MITFNTSVTNKEVLATINNPIQIMPATTNMLSDTAIRNYKQIKNENLLLHMNYITRIFSDKAVENNSKERMSLKQYATLAKKLGTKDILIHMPTNLKEMKFIDFGVQIVLEELVRQGIVVHFEIAAWTKEYVHKININESGFNNVSMFIDGFINVVKNYIDDEHWKIVLDTAHLHANGCKVEDMKLLFEKYKDNMKYAHLNGNINGMFTSDSHVTIFSNENKIVNSDELCRECSKMNLIFIAEVTKSGETWAAWEQFAEQYGFKLVPFSSLYAY